MGWGRRRQRFRKPYAVVEFDPERHARAKNERGWDWKPRQCCECNALFIPHGEHVYACPECFAEIMKILV